MPTRCTSLLAFMLALMFGASSVHADDLVVATHPYPPWIMHDADGGWTGISIDAWKHVARDAGLTYVIKDIEPREVMTKGLDALGADVMVSGGIGPRTEKVMDMTHPFIISGLGIATRSETSSATRILSKMLSWRFLRNLGVLLLIIVIVGVVVWKIEHKTSPEEFGGTPLVGIGGGVLWTIESLFSKPKPLSRRLRSRLVSLFWVMLCMILISGVTAKLASEFTVTQLTSKVSGPKDLAHARVGVVIAKSGNKGGGARYLDAHGIGYTTYIDEPRLALEALARGELDAVLDDPYTLRYLVHTQFAGKLLVLPDVIEPKPYAFGLRLGSPLMKKVNQALVQLVEDGDFKQIVVRYVGGSD